MIRVLVLAATLLPGLAQAAAGKVLFTVGKVEITRSGQVFPAARGIAFEAGDTISTGPTGMTQLRFQDGALMSLRYGTALVIEEFQLPKAMPQATRPAQLVSALTPGAGKPVTGGGGSSVFRLVRGAFRTITGLIGKGDGDDYRVITPAATIGIRGTDYSAAYCDENCGDSDDGLYVGVAQGEVSMTNEAGEQSLGENEYGYARDSSSAPEQTTVPPEALETPIEAPEGEAGEEASGDEAPDSEASIEATAGAVTSDDSAGDDATAERDEAAPAPAGDSSGVGGSQDFGANGPNTDGTGPVTEFQLQPGTPASFAIAYPDFAGSGDNGVYLEDGASADVLTGVLRSQFVSIGSAQNLNGGQDAQTGLRWGRWSGGAASVGGSALDLSQSSLHWIYALESQAPVIPLTGTASYLLVGNTDPTDSQGNVGFLGSASLSADFTNMSVSSSLSIGFSGGASCNCVLSASGFGDITGATFGGTYTQSVQTIGSFNGFFTDNASGAGISYTLDNGGNSVSGAAAFEQFQYTPPNGPAQ